MEAYCICFTSRSDLCYSVTVCACFLANLKENHLVVVMRIIKYVSSTVDYGICYSFDSNPNLIIFYNANWADNAKDRKSTLGGCFFLKNNVVS